MPFHLMIALAIDVITRIPIFFKLTKLIRWVIFIRGYVFLTRGQELE
jgi:hypothetical protein